MAKQKLCVGIDIGASAVKLCKLKKTGRGFVVEHFGRVDLPSETVVDGALMNSARVVDAILELTAAHRIRHKQVALSVSGHSVIIKKIPLPQMTRAELETQIQWEAEQFIPFDIEDVYLDVQIVNETSAQQGQMDVVLVAAKKDFVNEYMSVIIEAGLEPVICDVDAFAIETMFGANYDIPPEETVALVNVGAAKTNINIISGGVSSFTRDLAIGGNTFTEEIQKQLSVSQDDAETLKVGGNAADVTGVVPANVDQAIETIAENVTTEVQRSIDFYSATSADPSPSHVYLTGGSARLGALAKALSSRIGVPVSMADPFRQIGPGTNDPNFLSEMGTIAAVAVGLALRYPGDT